MPADRGVDLYGPELNRTASGYSRTSEKERWKKIYTSPLYRHKVGAGWRLEDTPLCTHVFNKKRQLNLDLGIELLACWLQGTACTGTRKEAHRFVKTMCVYGLRVDRQPPKDCTALYHSPHLHCRENLSIIIAFIFPPCTMTAVFTR